MAELKTQPTDADVNALLDAVPNATMRQDSFALVEMMRDITGHAPDRAAPVVGRGGGAPPAASRLSRRR